MSVVSGRSGLFRLRSTEKFTQPTFNKVFE
jgi:hypothetical protein